MANFFNTATSHVHVFVFFCPQHNVVLVCVSCPLWYILLLWCSYKYILLYLHLLITFLPQTEPPSSPQVYSSNTVYTTTNSIAPCWLSPSNAGGSPQGLYYNIYIQDLGTQSNQCLAKVNSSNSNAVGAICSTVSGLKSSTLYAVYVVAANAATVDPDTVCNITVLDGRYLAVVTETQSGAISAQTSANSKCCSKTCSSVLISSICQSCSFCFMHAHKTFIYIVRA